MDKQIKNYCSSCMNETNHLIKYKDEQSTSDDYHDVYFTYTYYVLACMGCDKVSFRTDYDDRDNVDFIEGEFVQYTDTTVYPQVIKNHKLLENAYHLPHKIGQLYKEMVKSIESECKIIAAAGFRALIEAICADKKIKGKDLKAKITSLKTAGLISNEDAKRLHSIRFMGNDALHEVEEPSQERIILVLQILEHLLSSVYLFNHLGKDILEFPIDDIEDFKKLIYKIITTNKISGEFTLKDLLGKSIRRVQDNFVVLESQLLDEIKQGNYKVLNAIGPKPYQSLGMVEHYSINLVGKYI